MNIAIIGGGLSGTLLTHYLLQKDKQPLTVYLFEKDYHQLSRGVAYRASSEGQLLNVPAERMNVLGSDADEFYHWLKSTVNNEIDREDFVPRALFGTYLKELFQKSIDQAKHVAVKVITDEVVDLIKDEDSIRVYTVNNHMYTVEKAVVANGILSPTDPFPVKLDVELSGLYQSNPWNFHYQDQLKNQDHVVLIGTGLTMLDHAVGLLKNGKDLKVTVFSRRGLLPLPHRTYHPYNFRDYSVIPKEDLGELLASIRSYYNKNKDNGLDWRDLVDKVRTQVPELWKALNATSKARFIRHLKPYWEIHRHRAPQQVLDPVVRAMNEGRFIVLKGKAGEVTTDGNTLIVKIVNTTRTTGIRANYLLNSSGLQQNISLTSDPLLKNLMMRGYMIPDRNGLGIETDDNGAMECAAGDKNIFTLGALRRAAELECTAAKEIGEQALRLSEYLISATPILSSSS